MLIPLFQQTNPRSPILFLLDLGILLPFPRFFRSSLVGKTAPTAPTIPTIRQTRHRTT
jgi:hypothetical protein